MSKTLSVLIEESFFINESVGRLAKEIRKSGLKPKIVSDLDKQDIHSKLPEIHLDGKKTPGDEGKFYDILKKTHGHEASKDLASSKKRPDKSELAYLNSLDYDWKKWWDAKKRFDAGRVADANMAMRHKDIAKEYQRDSELLKKKENKPLTKIKNKLIKNKDTSYIISDDGPAPIDQVKKIAKAVRAIENKDKANSLGLTPKELRTKMYEKRKNKNK